MKAWRFALAAAVAGLAGCGSATPTVTPPDRGVSPEFRGLFGDLTWTRDSSTGEWRRLNPEPTPVEQEDFKKWRESAGATERQEFEQWREWQEWKRKNPSK